MADADRIPVQPQNPKSRLIVNKKRTPNPFFFTKVPQIQELPSRRHGG
jgi:hypothetical protein